MNSWVRMWMIVTLDNPQPGHWIVRGQEAICVGAVFFEGVPEHQNDNERQRR